MLQKGHVSFEVCIFLNSCSNSDGCENRIYFGLYWIGYTTIFITSQGNQSLRLNHHRWDTGNQFTSANQSLIKRHNQLWPNTLSIMGKCPRKKDINEVAACDIKCLQYDASLKVFIRPKLNQHLDYKPNSLLAPVHCFSK